MKQVYQKQTIHKYISDNKTVYNSDHIGKCMGMGIKYMDIGMNIHIYIYKYLKAAQFVFEGNEERDRERKRGEASG